jgi:hypothetical protein
MRGTGFGVAGARQRSSLWAAAFAGASLSWQAIAGWSTRLDVAAMMPLRSTEFLVLGEGSVFSPSPVVARADLSVEFRF